MSKVFEDYFSELQADMVSICMEYVEDKADNIYIYCSCEQGCISADFFYCINKKMVKKHELNNTIDIDREKFKYDVSVERQEGVMDILIEDIDQIDNLCDKYNKEMPTEIKLIYDVSKNSLKAAYRYDLVYTNHPLKTADDISDEWFKELSRESK